MPSEAGNREESTDEALGVTGVVTSWRHENCPVVIRRLVRTMMHWRVVR